MDKSDALSNLLKSLRLRAGLFTEAAYCGTWAVDTSGMRMATFHLIQTGDCWLHLDGQPSRRLKPGDFVLFPRDARHVLSTSEDADADIKLNEVPTYDPELLETRMLCGYFEFASKTAWPLLDSLPEAVVLDLASTVVGDTRALLNLLVGEAANALPGRDLVIDQLAYVLFVHALRTHMHIDPAEEDTATGPRSASLLAALGDARIGRALNGIHQSPGDPWTVESLAAEAGMSRAAFASRFRQLTGNTPSRYLTLWRMELATDQLISTRQSIASIASSSGYRSEAAFRQAYAKLFGRPPGAVRRAGVHPSSHANLSLDSHSN